MSDRLKETLDTICKELSGTPIGETQQVASVFLKATLPFYDDIRTQARWSFVFALGATAVGLGFFIYALYVIMNLPGTDSETRSSWSPATIISAVAGALMQLIGGLNLHLYGKISKQFFAFHACLERIDRFMIANSLCEHLSANKDKVRGELVSIIADAPMLTFDLISDKVAQDSGHQRLEPGTLQKAAAASSSTS